MVDHLAVSLRSGDPDTTRAIGGVLAEAMRLGDVVALSGELGAGKTCLVQGVAAALGVKVPVTSPTFVLVKNYVGRLPIVHCDVYRLDRLAELDALGDDVMAPDTVTLIEWGDAVSMVLPPDRLEIELTMPGALTEDATTEPVRAIEIRAHGSWQSRWPDLARSLSDWTA